MTTLSKSAFDSCFTDEKAAAHRRSVTYTRLYSGRAGIQNWVSLLSSSPVSPLYHIWSPYTSLLDVNRRQRGNDAMCFLKPLGLQFQMNKKDIGRRLTQPRSNITPANTMMAIGKALNKIHLEEAFLLETFAVLISRKGVGFTWPQVTVSIAYNIVTPH